MAAGEALKLRIFIDKSVIEVFASDGRQAITWWIYPSAGNAGQVSLLSNAGTATDSSRQRELADTGRFRIATPAGVTEAPANSRPNEPPIISDRLLLTQAQELFFALLSPLPGLWNTFRFAGFRVRVSKVSRGILNTPEGNALDLCPRRIRRLKVCLIIVPNLRPMKQTFSLRSNLYHFSRALPGLV